MSFPLRHLSTTQRVLPKELLVHPQGTNGRSPMPILFTPAGGDLSIDGAKGVTTIAMHDGRRRALFQPVRRDKTPATGQGSCNQYKSLRPKDDSDGLCT